MISQQNKYLETALQTATPAQLLIMLTDGAIRFCKQAIEALKQRNFQQANKYLLKVQDIISEFVITLDKKSDISEGLLKLYEYFVFKLVEANTKKEPGPAEEILSFLLELKETWVQAAKLSLSTSAAANHG